MNMRIHTDVPIMQRPSHQFRLPTPSLRSHLFPLLVASLLPISSISAQGYRVRIDARAQAVSFRGLIADSVATTDIVTGANGGIFTSDGFAARCTNEAFCYFYRPGATQRGIPVSSSASLVLWGIGVQGLTIHASGRAVTDAGKDEVWPAVEPWAQLIEAYADYSRSRFTARAGRQFLTSRLEPIGFDGGWLRVRTPARGLDVTAYGGWGLGQAAVVPVSSPALSPLDEYRPRVRQLVAGGEVAWSDGPLDARAEYRREVDPEDDHFVSERAAASFTLQPWRFLQARGGIDYNLAEGHVGSGDLSLTYLESRFSVTGGARRYRPYFSLWTLWGAFSPVPYNTLHGSARVRITDWLTANGRAERYWYEPADVSTALVPDLEDRGWRVSLGGTVRPDEQWTFDGSYLADFGPGAASRSFDAGVNYSATPALTLGAYGGRLERPLELRFYDATTTWVGGRAEYRLRNQWRFWTDVAWYDDDRDRPDAGANSFDQVRLRGGVSLTFGTNADRAPLPRARRLRP